MSPRSVAGGAGQQLSPADVLERLANERRIVVVSHESPDGDAIGSLVAMTLVARGRGVECLPFIPGSGPLPPEYSFLPLQDEIMRGAMPTLDGAVVYALDCATPDRVSPGLQTAAPTTVNIDHHQDNASWGTFNLIDGKAASTTEILYRIFTSGMPVLDLDIATALYVGLVTDTGRFQYANTTPAAHRMAAELQDMGVDVNRVYQHVYSSEPEAKLRLRGIAMSRLQLRLGGRLAVSWLDLNDMAEAGAEDSFAEGIIDVMRTVKDAKVVALLRERESDEGLEIKVSLRSTDGSVDVSSIAHLWNGGGHSQAAGFTSCDVRESVLRGIECETLARLNEK